MKGRIFLLAIALVANIVPASAGFDSEAYPFDWVRPAKGGKYIFVMIAPPKWRSGSYHDYQFYNDATSYDSKEVEADLAKKYPKSGLYRNDGSKTPIWTVDWYSFDAWVCSDGDRLVRWGPWARSGDKGATLALAFYRKGVEVKQYRVVDLPQDYTRYPQSVSHYVWAKKRTFDDVGKRVKVVLFGAEYDREKEGKTLLFDLATGAMSAK